MRSVLMSENTKLRQYRILSRQTSPQKASRSPVDGFFVIVIRHRRRILSEVFFEAVQRLDRLGTRICVRRRVVESNLKPGSLQLLEEGPILRVGAGLAS